MSLRARKHAVGRQDELFGIFMNGRIDMNEKKNLKAVLTGTQRKPMPLLSFPSVQLLGCKVGDFVQDAQMQARGICAIAQRYPMAAAVSMMDLSVEAEAFGAQIRFDDHEVPSVIGAVAPGAQEVRQLPVPAVGAARTGEYLKAVSIAAQEISDRPVLAGVIGPFSLAGRLMDMTEIMVNCYVDPETVHLLLEKVTSFLVEYCRAYTHTGAAGIVIAEPAAGLLSPELNQEFSVPYVKQMIEAVQSENFGVIYHNCGNVVPLLDDLLSIGAQGYHFGNAVDLAEVLARVPADTPVLGNIDPVSCFRNGTCENMENAVRTLCDRLKQYPNFVLSSGCDIPPASKMENIEAFFKAAQEVWA